HGPAARDSTVARLPPGYDRYHPLERWSLLERGHPLRVPEVAAAVHTDLAVRAGHPGGPGHRVIAVLGLTPERLPITVRREPAPSVLDHHHLAPANSLHRVQRRRAQRQVLAAWTPGQQGRAPALTNPPVDVCTQHRAGPDP